MTRSPGLARRRLLAVVLLVAVVVIPLALVAVPLWSAHQEYRETESALGRRLGALREQNARRPEIEARYQAERKRQERDARLLAGATAALAGAELQGIVKRVVEQHGGNIATTQVLPIAGEGRFGRLSIKVRLTVGLPGLVGVLYALENGSPYLFVDDVTVRAPRAGRGAATGPLTVDLQLSGYLRTASS